MHNTEAFIVRSLRTAIGKARKGALANVRPEKMGADVVRGVVENVEEVSAEDIDDVIMGCAFPEGPQGMNVARVIALKAGLPQSVPGATVNRFCSSGLQAIATAAQSILAGQNDIVVAGGVESMSLVPMGGFYFSPDYDQLMDNPDTYVDMGNTAENVATKFEVSREDQDRFSLHSHEKAVFAINSGIFTEEIVPLVLRENIFHEGSVVEREFVFETDEGPRSDSTLELLAKLPPVFRQNGTVTAGNSSQVSDGAAASIVMGYDTVKRFNVEPMARYVGFAVAGVAPEIMGIGPIEAVPKVLKRTGLKISDIGLIELNEAFASQALAVIRSLDLDPDTVNVNGGAIALGHPLGCTGAKLTASLLHEMRRRKVRYGLVTMCIGGGMGAAGVFENLSL